MRGTDGKLYRQWETSVGTFSWSGWAATDQPGPVPFVGHPVLAASAGGRLALFITGADGNVWHCWQIRASDGWSGWVPLDPPAGTQGSAPGVWASGDGRLELFVTGGDGALWHRWQTRPGNGWSKWASAGHP